MDVPPAQDPLGLARAAFDENPDSTDPVAIRFDTRKSYSQYQVGLAVRHELARELELRGVAYVGQRRGYQNFVGSTLGVPGALRRDEENRTTSADVYAQADVTLAPAWSAFAGVRNGRVRLKSEDRYVVPGNPDDSGSAEYRKTTPAVGVVFRPSSDWRLCASAGRGFETPTFNEVATSVPTGALPPQIDARPALPAPPHSVSCA